MLERPAPHVLAQRALGMSPSPGPASRSTVSISAGFCTSVQARSRDSTGFVDQGLLVPDGRDPVSVSSSRRTGVAVRRALEVTLGRAVIDEAVDPSSIQG